MVFRFCKKQPEIVAGIGKTGRERRIRQGARHHPAHLAGQPRRRRQCRDELAVGQFDESAQRGKKENDEGLRQRVAAARRSRLLFLARLVGGCNQAAANFGAGILRLVRRDQAGGSVTIDLGHLVAIDLDVMAVLAAGCCRAAQERRE